jgi:hypothetical protein
MILSLVLLSSAYNVTTFSPVFVVLRFASQSKFVCRQGTLTIRKLSLTVYIYFINLTRGYADHFLPGTWRHIPKHRYLHSHHRENHKSQIVLVHSVDYS